jgi:hypothetical protein
MAESGVTRGRDARSVDASSATAAVGVELFRELSSVEGEADALVSNDGFVVGVVVVGVETIIWDMIF